MKFILSILLFACCISATKISTDSLNVKIKAKLYYAADTSCLMYIDPTDSVLKPTKIKYDKVAGKILDVGDYRVVADTTARNLIPESKRSVGMVVHCIAENRDYKLIGGITNSNWQLIPIQFTLPHISSPTFSFIDEDDEWEEGKVFSIVVPEGNGFNISGGSGGQFGFNSSGDFFVLSNLYINFEAPKITLNGDTVVGDYFSFTGAVSSFTSTSMYNAGNYYSNGSIFLGDTSQPRTHVSLSRKVRSPYVLFILFRDGVGHR